MKLEVERFSPETIRPVSVPSRDMLRELYEVRLLQDERGQRFSARFMNRDYASNRPIVRFGQMFGTVMDPGTQYGDCQLAILNPQTPIISIDMPSHGRSDNLTDAQRRQIDNEARMTHMAKAQLGAIRTALPNASDVVYEGQSLGALIAVEAAVMSPEYGFNPLLVVGYEMVGLDKRPSLNMTAAYFLYEQFMERFHYKKQPRYKHLNQAFQEFENLRETTGLIHNPYKPIDIYRHDPKLMEFIIHNSPLATDKGYEVIEEALEANNQMALALVSGGLSQVSRIKKIVPRMQRLIGEFEGRLTWDIWPSDSHAISGYAPLRARAADATSYAVSRI